MTPYKIEFHADISADFSEAYIWYEHRANGLGEKFLSAVRAKIEQIAQSPDTYGEKHKKDTGNVKWIYSLTWLFTRFTKRKKLSLFLQYTMSENIAAPSTGSIRHKKPLQKQRPPCIGAL